MKSIKSQYDKESSVHLTADTELPIKLAAPAIGFGTTYTTGAFAFLPSRRYSIQSSAVSAINCMAETTVLGVAMTLYGFSLDLHGTKV